MKRKLMPLIACPELHNINKTMIIKVPLKFRESGHPVFRIVSSLDDFEKPRVKFKANELLKTILEKGTDEEILDSFSVEVKEETLLKQTKQLSNNNVRNEEVPKTIVYQKLSGRETGTEYTPISSFDSDPKQTVDRFSLSSRNFSVEAGYCCKDNKECQKISSVSGKEHLSVFKNLQNTGSECEAFQLLPKSIQLASQEQEILPCKVGKTFGKLCCHHWGTFKDSEDFRSSRGVNGNNNYRCSRELIDEDGLSACMNCGSSPLRVTPESNPVTTQKWESLAFKTPQNKDLGPIQNIDHSKDYKSFQQKEYHKPKVLQHKNLAFRMCDKRNCNSDQFQLSEDCDSGPSSGQKSLMSPGPFCQHSDFSDFHQCSSNDHQPLGSAGQNDVKSLSQHHHSGFKTEVQELSYGDSSGAGSENIFSNKSSSWSIHRSSNQERSDSSQSVPGYSPNKNDKVLHQGEQKQRTHGPASRSSNKRPNQVTSENIYKSANELPKHCFWKELNWSEMKQILFLDALSYPNFFREFEKIPPQGMHIWTFMPSTYKLKYPNELVNHRLLNMKLLHVTLGDINVKFPDTVYDLHCRLPLSAQFVIVSNRQFDIVKSIKDSRTVNLVCPKFSEGMSEIFRYIFKVDA